MNAKATKKLIRELQDKIEKKQTTLQMLEHGKNNPTVSPLYHSTQGQIEALDSIINLLQLYTVHFKIL